jgi:hypothetical protein
MIHKTKECPRFIPWRMIETNGLKTFILGLSTHNDGRLFEQSVTQTQIVMLNWLYPKALRTRRGTGVLVVFKGPSVYIRPCKDNMTVKTLQLRKEICVRNLRLKSVLSLVCCIIVATNSKKTNNSKNKKITRVTNAHEEPKVGSDKKMLWGFLQSGMVIFPTDFWHQIMKSESVCRVSKHSFVFTICNQ